MRVGRWLAWEMLALLAASPAGAGGRGNDRDEAPLSSLRGSLLEGGGIAAPFGDPGTRIGRFSVRASRHGDVRVDPGSVQVQVPGGMLVATAAGPEEDVRGLLALCELGLGPVLCRPMFQPIRPLPPFPFRPSPLPDLPNPFLPAPLPPGCGPFFDPSCGEPITEPSDPPPPGSGFGRRDFVWVDGVWIPNDLPEDGPPIVTLPIEFVSEMAMVSWNALMALVALSRVDGEPGTEDFDRENPFRTDGCSFANPGLCSNVRDIGALRTDGWRFDTLPDDPRRTGTLWLHEAAIAYEVVRARGHLAGLEGGWLFAYGPFASHLPGSTSGVALLALPPEDAALDDDSPLAWQAPGPNRIPGTSDDVVVGLAWGAAQQASDGMTKRPHPRERPHPGGKSKPPGKRGKGRR